ncbi:GNAT family N-acetyltransferase [Thalassobacillus pellis]|uniref:GNAT family N-acetyltransferase n=1 Tax=Thalassobacillus pellis TaxID=748008 RepID=UPI0019610607|nr:GNAT family N-acetyltransferase [Thalassobacillus pellis]MBM7551827.1 N-acetylglutamate synthase-like GNAT family acetyltransferase [Thalassobacillus pellis]
MVEITLLEHRNAEIAKEIEALQQLSYHQEAKYINNDKLPPLTETYRHIQQAQENFLGTYKNGKLAGLLACHREEEVIWITRLAVHPEWMRKGIGSDMLTYIFDENNFARCCVTTGLKNRPAMTFYQEKGFVHLNNMETEEGIMLALLCYEQDRSN